jgi:hypothetical protein
MNTAHALETAGLISWTGMIDPMLRGIVLRRNDLALAVSYAWTALVLPYYREPYYQESKTGAFVRTAITVVPDEDLNALTELLRRRIEAEGAYNIRATLLVVLLDGLQARGISNGALKRAVERWRKEAPPPSANDGSSLDPYIAVQTLSELSKALASRENDYWATRATERLIVSGTLSEAREFANAHPTLVRDSGVICAMARLAASTGERSYAEALLEGLRPQSDERVHWDRWRGGAKLDYFRLLVDLNGTPARSRAFAELADDLAAGGEWPLSLLVDMEEVLEIVSSAPDWAAIWDLLAYQLSQFREYRLGELIAGAPVYTRTDEQLIAHFYKQAFSLQLTDPSRQARVGLILGRKAPGGREILYSLIDRLLEKEGEGSAEGMGLLSAVSTDQGVADHFALKVGRMQAHPDFAVSVVARRLAQDWGLRVEHPVRKLPSYYDLVFDDGERGDLFQAPAQLELNAIDDPLAWTWLFERPIRLISEASGITLTQLRRRCHQFIREMGDLETIRLGKNHSQTARLRQLQMRLPFPRPYIMATIRALRQVVGELLYAGRLDGQAEELLLHELGFPATGALIMAPAERPLGLPRPEFGQDGIGDKPALWVEAVAEDLRPFQFGDDTVLAEITRFEKRRYGRTFTVERLRLRALGESEFASIDAVLGRLPPVLNLRCAFAAYRPPSKHLIARFVPQGCGLISTEPPVICPHWASRLNWSSHPNNFFVYRDWNGTVVARTIWWRDGSPRDVRDDSLRGEGFLVLATPAGAAQLRKMTGELEIEARCWRSVIPERDGDPIIRDQARLP